MSIAKVILDSWKPTHHPMHTFEHSPVQYQNEGLNVTFAQIEGNSDFMVYHYGNHIGVYDRSECRRFARVLLSIGFEQISTSH